MLRSAPKSASVMGGDLDYWYKDAVIYELHVRAFQDSDADGIGDFRGLITRLDYLQNLGVTAVWLLPFYPSPLRDDGYDISDYRHIHPSYGTLRDFRLFLREAHMRGLRVITELVLAHTSDEHPWFQRARRAPPDSEHRDYYLWTDTPDRFAEARIIFKDFENSNWTYDPVAHAYFFHRFYSHQPSLNYDNPAVQRDITEVVDYWMEMGVDGMRLDAVPYLYAREGTTCENLPEVFAFLRKLRAHVDERFQGRMLLAEANQWPEDAVAYMGDGDACHMAFHFPLMPRMFMAARQEDRFPIVDILAETPPVPPDCQWALFLRNHDELTLEMVTDEERDYMYRVYAQDPRARVNVGIRRRLAPLLGNDRTMIEMMNGLLFSLPGTPIIYYGDEIGMGDNIYLGDRNAVRTPMQWGSDRNAGFSRANPQRLYLPVIIDPGYHADAVNVEAQQENPSSLLWWMQRLVALRNRYRAFSRGTLEMLFPDNRKVLAFLRRFEDEKILVIVNLSRYAQAVELDLSGHRGAVPVELFGSTEFPPIGDLPYFITLGPHGFYWFSLVSEEPSEPTVRPTLEVQGRWDAVFAGSALLQLEDFLPGYLAERRWFAAKSNRIKSVELFEAAPLPGGGTNGGGTTGTGDLVGILAMLGVELGDGTVSTYVLPLAFATGPRAEELDRGHPEAVITGLRVTGAPGSDPVEGVLYDAVWSPDFASALVDAVVRRRQLRGHAGRLVGVPAPPLRRMTSHLAEVAPSPMSAEQSNTSIAFGNQLIAKVLRRVEFGTNPAVEMGRFLAERARFGHSPAVGGALEYRSFGPGSQPVTVATLEEFVPNEGDGWSFVVDSLARGLEEVLAAVDPGDVAPLRPTRLLDMARAATESGGFGREDGDDAAQLLVGPHLEWSALLGRRTAEMHVALASEKDDSFFTPEPLTAIERQAMFHSARGLTKRSFQAARRLMSHVPEIRDVLGRDDDVVGTLQHIVRTPIRTSLIRCHGDFHLGQVLWTGKDFVIVDFEGEPARSLSQRRLKRPALTDVAGMIRSFHYASQAAARQVTRSLGAVPGELEPWIALWYRAVTGTFLRSYLDLATGQVFLPDSQHELGVLLDFLVLEKAVYELGYEANSRPDWVAIPARGILELLGSSS
jgi:maltose alpha-D-glucosyltransferase/alpha-amylase